jgi:hypothetical protein
MCVCAGSYMHVYERDHVSMYVCVCVCAPKPRSRGNGEVAQQTYSTQKLVLASDSNDKFVCINLPTRVEHTKVATAKAEIASWEGCVMMW